VRRSPYIRLTTLARSVLANRGWATAARVLFCAAVTYVVFLADSRIAVDQLDSPLYRATLEKTFDRFREDDVVVPYQRGNAPHGEGVVDASRDSRVAESLPKTASDAASEKESWATASARFDSGDYAGALALMTPLRARYPRDTTLLHKIADALSRTGNDADAIDTYREVLRINPEYNCCREHIRDLYERSGRRGLAAQLDVTIEREYRREAARTGKDGVAGRRSLARHLSERTGAHAEAVALMEGLVADDPNDADLLLSARCLARCDRKADALLMLDRIRGGDTDVTTAAAKLRAQLTGRVATAEEIPESSATRDHR
jgi:tetratricopeptide (TPR) repeat protein